MTTARKRSRIEDRPGFDLRTKTAYHEAGHALGYFVFHVPFDGVSIRREPDSYGRVFQKVPREFRVNDLTPRELDGEIILCLAGPASEARLTGRTCWRGGAVDFKEAFDMVAKLEHLHVEDIEPYLRALWTRANHLFRRPGHWLGVERVAAGLLQREELTYSEVAAILQASLEYDFDSWKWRLTPSPTLACPMLHLMIRRGLRR